MNPMVEGFAVAEPYVKYAAKDAANSAESESIRTLIQLVTRGESYIYIIQDDKLCLPVQTIECSRASNIAIKTPRGFILESILCAVRSDRGYRTQKTSIC